MKKFVAMFLRHWRTSPVEIGLTVFSVALGTGILAISFSASEILRDRVTSGMAREGALLYVANATMNADGSQVRVVPAEWDADAPSRLVAESGAVSAAAIVAAAPFDEAFVNGSSYRLRSAVGTSPEYLDLFSLKLVRGSPMSALDVALGAKRVWISEQLAAIFFGSADDAVGRRIRLPERPVRRGAESEGGKAGIVDYSVAGVFAAPSEAARRSYGIADLVLPYTSMIPTGADAAFERRMMARTFVALTSAAPEKQAEAAIRRVLSADYPESGGRSASILVWEGSPRGVSGYLVQLRQAIRTFTVSVNALGLVLLALSCLGIFSVMVVELLGRRKEIALERALGASRMAVVKEFWIWSVSLSLIGAAVGILIAIPLSGPVLRAMSPLAGEVSDRFRSGAGLAPASIVEGVALALACGGLLGALPAFAAMKGPISEGLHDGPGPSA
jgi:putative ABC transport system permease protein